MVHIHRGWLRLQFTAGTRTRSQRGYHSLAGLLFELPRSVENAQTVAINNVNLRLERDFELKHLFLGVWGEMMLNCYGLDKTNLTTTLEEKENQRLNWRIGASLYFGNEW